MVVLLAGKGENWKTEKPCKHYSPTKSHYPLLSLKQFSNLHPNSYPIYPKSTLTALIIAIVSPNKLYLQMRIA
jgi:hypothetical protein